MTKPKLRVRVGPSPSTLAVINVNDDTHPQFIDSPYFSGYIVVRVKDFDGITPNKQPPIKYIPYFGTRKRCFSIQVTGRWKKEVNVNDLVFGAEFDRKVNPPTGSWVAMKFANLIDPALSADIYAEKPWLFSPLLCSMNIVNVKPAPLATISSVPAVSSSTPSPSSASTPSSQLSSPNTILNINNITSTLNNTRISSSSELTSISSVNPSHPHHSNTSIASNLSQRSSSCSNLSLGELSRPAANITGFNPADILGEWQWGGEKELEEDTTLLHNISINDSMISTSPSSATLATPNSASGITSFSSLSSSSAAASLPFSPTDVNERRSYYRKEHHRKLTTLRSDKVYHFEIFAPFINLNTFDLSLGVNINVHKYVNGQPIRLVCRTKPNLGSSHTNQSHHSHSRGGSSSSSTSSHNEESKSFWVVEFQLLGPADTLDMDESNEERKKEKEGNGEENDEDEDEEEEFHNAEEGGGGWFS